MAGRLEGKTAIITGAASGMGRAASVLFAREGAQVVATDRTFDTLTEVVGEIVDAGGKAVGVDHDVSSESSWVNVVEQALSSFGAINVLVNNAATQDRKGILEAELDDWNFIMSVNCTGVWLGMKNVIPSMRAGGSGSIVNTSSVAGIVSAGGGAGAAYAASKGAVRSLTKHAAGMFASDSIRVNSVHPGLVLSGLSARPGVSSAADLGEQIGRIAGVPLPPFAGEPIDIANAYLYLASDDSKYVTGAEFVIDGGFTTR